MSPSIAPPAPDVLATIMAEHTHRYPEKATVDVTGDGGISQRLPLLIGNPTGTNKSPTGEQALAAWANLCAATFGARKASYVSGELVRDCLIFPGRGLLAQWEERWPAIIDSMGTVVLRKIGADKALVRAPRPDEKVPDAIAELLKATPAAVWRWVDCGPPIPVVVSPPSKPHWDALTSALQREGTDCIALLDDLMSACVKGDGIAARLKQWPGLALPLENVVVSLAGAQADARLGEW